MKNSAAWFVMALATGLGFGAWGCASFERHVCESSATTNTFVRIDSSPQGAVGKASNGRVVKTPVLMALKSNESVTIEFTKDGYEPAQVQLDSGMNPWILGNILTAGLGILYDMEKGATRSLSPSGVHLQLRKLGSAANPPMEK